MKTLEDELLYLLDEIYELYENGDPCYTYPDTCDGYIGTAIRIGQKQKTES